MSDNQVLEASGPAPDAPGREATIRVTPKMFVPPGRRAIRIRVRNIRSHHRRRRFAMEQRKAMDNALGAFLRTQLGWSRDLPKAESDTIKKRVQELIAIGEALVKRDRDLRALGQALRDAEDDKTRRRIEARLQKRTKKPVEGIDDPDFFEWEQVIEAAVTSRQPWDDIEKEASRAMEHLVQDLPVWPWAAEIRGFGALGLAQVVAETGLVSCDPQGPSSEGNYPNPGKLWKRMGLAVMDGKRQGGLSKSAPAAAWIEHAYNRSRRSVMWNIGQTLIKLNGDGPYKQLYDERKVIERGLAEADGLTVAPAAKIPKGEKDKYRSDGHIANRAQRYMEKRLLRDLWQAWREAEVGVTPSEDLPPAETTPAAEAVE